jgi:hypothetical protein
MAAVMDDVVCDRVVVRDRDASRDMTIDEFFRIPLAERLQLVIGGAVRFFSGDGEVAPREALAALRKRRAF